MGRAPTGETRRQRSSISGRSQAGTLVLALALTPNDTGQSWVRAAVDSKLDPCNVGAVRG